jgi:2-hydroxychromene-2-carboxylate isomerase
MQIDDLPGGPHDVEYFFDPGCPFAWQTSVWMRKVAEQRGVRVGWRFISLRMVNEGKEQPPELTEAQERCRRFHRICVAARERCGNEVVGELYRAWGERYWYEPGEGELWGRMAAAARRLDPAEVLAALDLPADLVEAADDEGRDHVLRAETEEAFRRTGPDVGTPIITYGPPDGNSFFGPVISDVPEGEDVVRLYDALRTLADLRGFSELKRTDRRPPDLPLLAG